MSMVKMDFGQIGGARGFWEPQTMSVFDVSIFHPDSSLYKSQPLTATFEHKRNIKNKHIPKQHKQRERHLHPLLRPAMLL